jgi:hypothetical protein
MGPGFRRDGDYDFFTASAVFQSHTPGAGRAGCLLSRA